MGVNSLPKTVTRQSSGCDLSGEIARLGTDGRFRRPATN